MPAYGLVAFGAPGGMAARYEEKSPEGYQYQEGRCLPVPQILDKDPIRVTRVDATKQKNEPRADQTRDSRDH
jgi:hypothetical protein